MATNRYEPTRLHEIARVHTPLLLSSHTGCASEQRSGEPLTDSL